MPDELETWYVETDHEDREELFAGLDAMKDAWETDPTLFEAVRVLLDRAGGIPSVDA